MRTFGVEAYFVNVPSRFISSDGKNTWLIYAVNFAEMVQREPRITRPRRPEGSRYGTYLQESVLHMSA